MQRDAPETTATALNLETIGENIGQSPYTSLQNFELCNTIEEGHFSTVYFGKNVLTGVKVALKRVQVDLLKHHWRWFNQCQREACDYFILAR